MLKKDQGALLDWKRLKGHLVSGSACRWFGSSHSVLTNKKVNRLRDQQIFFWIHKRGEDIGQSTALQTEETGVIAEQRCLRGNHCGIWCWCRKTFIGEPLGTKRYGNWKHSVILKCPFATKDIISMTGHIQSWRPSSIWLYCKNGNFSVLMMVLWLCGRKVPVSRKHTFKYLSMSIQLAIDSEMVLKQGSFSCIINFWYFQKEKKVCVNFLKIQ